MSEAPGEHLDEEPQEERGPEGSRDTGSDEPSGGRSTGPRAGPTTRPRTPTPVSTRTGLTTAHPTCRAVADLTTTRAPTSEASPDHLTSILVAGIGNIFLGDDGFGPEVVRRVEPDPRAEVRTVDYGIRGVHLAYDLLDARGTADHRGRRPGAGRAGIDRGPRSPTGGRRDGRPRCARDGPGRRARHPRDAGRHPPPDVRRRLRAGRRSTRASGSARSVSAAVDDAASHTVHRLVARARDGA